jgi:hypothetical protein
MIVTFFSLAHGGTTRLVSGSAEAIAANAEPGEDWIEGSWFKTHYIDLDTREPVPLMEMNLVVSTNFVGDLPTGTLALVEHYDEVLTVDDGTLEIESPFNDALRVELWHPHYHPISLKVTCEAAE